MASPTQKEERTVGALRVNERAVCGAYSGALVSSYKTESYVCRWETDVCLIKAAVFGQQWKKLKALR